ncbi:MAG: hypothetical protein K8R45_12735, partial [Desulfobacterales bacterium]|nr:hypothetical protein [Desulfobacterales bacterium]
MKKDVGQQEETSSVCPVSGLPVLRKPEWTEVRFGKEYCLTLSVIGKRILLAQSTGYGRRQDVKNAMRLVSQVLDEVLGDDVAYVHISDYSKLKGASLAARKYYMDYLKKQDGILDLIFLGAMPIVNMSIKLVKRISRVKYGIHVVDDYSKAVSLALDKLKDFKVRSGDPYICDTDGMTVFQKKDEYGHAAVINPIWNLQTEDFSVQFEIIEGNIIHTTAKGFLREKDVVPLHELREKVVNSISSPNDIYFIVAGVGDLKGGSRKARRKYLASLRDAYNEKPFQYIMYGTNWFLRTAINVSRQFLP